MAVDEADVCVDGSEFFKTLRGHAAEKGVPVAAAIALTYRCNFRCVHCYARSSEKRESELGCEEWIGIIDQLAAAGCLFLLITGGEPLLRPDFGEIYLHAKKRGMLVTVFTNASLLNESHIRLFAEYPPRLVDISLYGMSSAVHQATTGVEGYSEMCLKAVQTLHREGIRVALKTVPMKANRREFGQMRSLAQSLGVKFRYDACITPQLDGGRLPIHQRLSASEAVALEFSDPQRVEKWMEIHKRKHEPRGEGLVYRCSAGRTLAFIGPDGCVHPCVSASHRRYPSARDSFAVAWGRMVRDINTLRTGEDSACVKCEKSVYCGLCPAFCHLDGGREAGPSRFLCELGEARVRCLKAMSDGRRA